MTVPETFPSKEEAARWQELFFCFLVATGAAWLTTLLRQPLGLLFSEEFLDLAQVLYSTGSLESLHRPPGFVAFLALLGYPNPALFSGHLISAYLVQGVVHGLTTAMLREEMGWSVRGTAPLFFVLTFGLSPVALIGAGFLHYDTLHVFLLVLTAAACRRALSSHSRPWHAVSAGVVAAVLALVRPMTLPWPLILLALTLFVHEAGRREYSRRAALLLMGFALTLIPYAVRNFQKTGRVILVNAQTGAALWPMTEVELSPKSADYPWVRLWVNVGRPLVAARAPELSMEEDPFLTHTLRTNDLFLARSFENLSESPMRFVRNVCRNAWFFLTGSQETYVHFLRLTQGEQRLLIHPVRRFFVAANEILVVMTGLVALIYSLRHKRSSCLAAGSLLICLWMVHSGLYLDFRYLYVRAPLCVLIAGITFLGAEPDKRSWIGKAISTIPYVMISSTLVAFVAVYF